jgi:hypothetical protein
MRAESTLLALPPQAPLNARKTIKTPGKTVQKPLPKSTCQNSHLDELRHFQAVYLEWCSLLCRWATTETAIFHWQHLVQQFNSVALPQSALYQDSALDAGHTIVGLSDLS